MSLATPSGVLVGVERATPRRLVYCVAFVGLWVSYTFYSANLDNEPFEHVGWALLATSVALGFAVGRWWAPLVVIVYLPTLAIPSGYGGGTPDYGVGLAVAVVVLPVVAGLIAIGVLARKTFSPGPAATGRGRGNARRERVRGFSTSSGAGAIEPWYGVTSRRFSRRG